MKRPILHLSSNPQPRRSYAWWPLPALLLTFTLAASIQVKAQHSTAVPRQEPESIKLGSLLVSFPVTVLDRSGKAVPNLTQESFEVYDQGVKQELEFFSTSNAPVSAGLVVDLSSSMHRRSLRVQQAIAELTNYQRDGDEYFMIAFNQRPWLQIDFTTDFREVARSVGLLEPKGTTALYDAVYLALEKIRHASRSRKAIIVLSDGQDNHSRYEYEDVRRLAEEADATIFSVALPGIWGSDDELEVAGRRVLRELADSTGGNFYVPNSASDLERVFTSIGAELRFQYQVAYVPSESQVDGQWHHLKVRLVKLPKERQKVVVRAKAGYWARR